MLVFLSMILLKNEAFCLMYFYLSLCWGEGDLVTGLHHQQLLPLDVIKEAALRTILELLLDELVLCLWDVHLNLWGNRQTLRCFPALGHSGSSIKLHISSILPKYWEWTDVVQPQYWYTANMMKSPRSLSDKKQVSIRTQLNAKCLTSLAVLHDY